MLFNNNMFTLLKIMYIYKYIPTENNEIEKEYNIIIIILLLFKTINHTILFYSLLKYLSFSKCGNNSLGIENMFNNHTISYSRLIINRNKEIIIGIEDLDLHCTYLPPPISNSIFISDEFIQQEKYCNYPEKELEEYINAIYKSINIEDVIFTILNYFEAYYTILNNRINKIYYEIKNISSKTLNNEDYITYNHFINLLTQPIDIKIKEKCNKLKKIPSIIILLQRREEIKNYNNVLKLGSLKLAMYKRGLNIYDFIDFIDKDIRYCFIECADNLALISRRLYMLSSFKFCIIETFTSSVLCSNHAILCLKRILFRLYNKEIKFNDIITEENIYMYYKDNVKKLIIHVIREILFYMAYSLYTSGNTNSYLFKNLLDKYKRIDFEFIIKTEDITFEKIYKLYSMLINLNYTLEDIKNDI